MILDDFALRGRVALVTGCSGGLGREMVLALAEAGADIVGAGISDASEVARDVQSLGRRFHHVAADLRGVENAAPAVEATIRAFGRLDILVNNAGIIRRADALDFTEADWDTVMNVNLKSAFFLSQAAARHFVEQGEGGRIVNIASLLSFQGGIRVASYTASKSGLAGLTRLLACEWAKHGIAVNAIAPGYMATSNTEALRADPVRSKEISARIPAGRWGEPADLKGAVVFLASRAAAYVTGHTLVVDGGWMAR